MEFLLIALLAGLMVAITAAPLGAFIVWQRLAYFGETLAHASLLGVALGLILSISIELATIFACALAAIILLIWQRKYPLASDTSLGIISHSSLALGLILVTLSDGGRLDLSSYLLGDILSTSKTDLIIIGAVGLLVLTLVWRFWSSLLTMTVSEDLAEVEGVPVTRTRLLLLLLLALTIAVAIKIVGVLLITALLIIPAATARFWTTTPEQMVFFAGGFGTLAVICGLALSFFVDTPAGPSIVISASGMFLMSMLLAGQRA